MKFNTFILAFIIFFTGFAANAQFIPFDNLCITCAPNPSLFSNQSNLALGIEPSFAIISQGVVVDLPLTYMMPLQFEVGPPIAPIPVTADVYFIDIISINWGGLTGLSATPDATHYVPSTNRFGCINICGITNSAPATYSVRVKVYAEGGALGQTGGDTATVDFDVLVLPPGNPYFNTTPPESCIDTTSVNVVVNITTFENLYNLDIYPTEYIWTLPDGSNTTGETPAAFDVSGTGNHIITLNAKTYEYIVTEVNVSSVSGAWWAGFFDDGALIGGSDPDLEFLISNGSNNYTGSEITDNFSPTWNLSSSPFSLTDQAISIAFSENDLIGSDDGGTATFTVNGIGNYNFSTTGNKISGTITIGQQLINITTSTDTLIVHPNVNISNLSISDTICSNDSILLSASASFSNFEWYDGAGTLIDTTQTIYVHAEDIYYVKARATPSALCLSTSNLYAIFVNTIASPAISQTMGSLEIDNANAYDVQWFSNSVPIPGATNDDLTDLSSGNPFSVSITNAAGCSNTSSDFFAIMAGTSTQTGTNISTTEEITFEASNFSLCSGQDIAWAVSTEADGAITDMAELQTAIDNGWVYPSTSLNTFDASCGNVTFPPGDYYMTPFSADVIVTEPVYWNANTDSGYCDATMEICIGISGTGYSINPLTIELPNGTIIDVLAQLGGGIVPAGTPITPELWALATAQGGDPLCIDLIDILGYYENPNGVWKIKVPNNGTGALDFTVNDFNVTVSASNCDSLATDQVTPISGVSGTVAAGATSTFEIVIPPFPTNFPQLTPACLLFGDATTFSSSCINGIEDLIDVENVNLFPNPNNGLFTVEFDINSVSNVNISIVDITGRKVLYRNYPNAVDRFSETFDLKNNLNSGFYFLDIQVGNEHTQKKFIVK